MPPPQPGAGPTPIGTPPSGALPSEPAGPKQLAGVSLKVWAAIATVAAVAIVGAIVLVGGDDSKKTDTSITTVAAGDTTATPNDTTLNDTTPGETTLGDTTPDDTTPEDTAPNVTTPSDEPAEGEVAGAPAGQIGTRAQPVPAGAIANIGGGFRLQVLGITPDATAEMLAFNEFNDAPPAGSTYTLVNVALGYFGSADPISAFMPTINAIGAASVALETCYGAPDELDTFGELFAGGVMIGNLCFLTTPADIDGLQLAGNGDFFAEEPVILQAASSATATPMVGLQGPQPGAAASPERIAAAPIGTTKDVGEGWSVTVNSPARDITDEVLADSEFNDPPPTGYRFIGVEVTYAYNGGGSDSGFTVGTSAVSDSNVRLDFECGLIPTPLDEFAEVFTGGQITGLLCFVAPEGASGLTLYSRSSFDSDLVVYATS